jgi:3-hydroxyisobutyrate dehydrogenase-like beta-hydroxyacid dehydrogenase
VHRVAFPGVIFGYGPAWPAKKDYDCPKDVYFAALSSPPMNTGKQNRTPAQTVAVLYPGDMGSALGKLLRQAGYRVVTTLEGRGSRTQVNCQDCGFEVLASFQDVAREAEIVFSLVPPKAARDIARNYATSKPASDRAPLYVDLNSISPESATEIGDILQQAGLSFVDGAIHGVAGKLRERGRVYLSGSRAQEVAKLLGPLLYVQVLGDVPGQASAFRMLISGLTKGVIALFLEISMAARGTELLPELLACFHDTYPGIMEVVERILPTYPQHSRRRADEMHELEQMMEHRGLGPCLVQATQRLLTELASLGLAEDYPDKTSRDWSVTEIVEEVYKRGLLRKGDEKSVAT